MHFRILTAKDCKSCLKQTADFTFRHPVFFFLYGLLNAVILLYLPLVVDSIIAMAAFIGLVYFALSEHLIGSFNAVKSTAMISLGRSLRVFSIYAGLVTIIAACAYFYVTSMPAEQHSASAHTEDTGPAPIAYVFEVMKLAGTVLIETYVATAIIQYAVLNLNARYTLLACSLTGTNGLIWVALPAAVLRYSTVYFLDGIYFFVAYLIAITLTQLFAIHLVLKVLNLPRLKKVKSAKNANNKSHAVSKPAQAIN